MTQFRVGHAQGATWQQIAQACLTQIGDIPSKANLGFLYTTDSLVVQLPSILAHFKHATNIEHWVGTVGMGICGGGYEYFDEPAIAAMIGEFPENSFRVFSTIKSSTEDFVRDHASWCEKTNSHFSIVHGDPRNADIPEFVERLANEITGGFLVGGLTSSRGSYSQIATDITDGGISGVLFAQDVPVTTALTQGCSPIGIQHEITECDGNVAITLDGRPAFDVFQEEAGAPMASELKRAAGHIFAALPIKGSDTGDYVVRHLVGFDPEKGLLAVGDKLEAGNAMMFCRRDADSAYKDMRRMLQNIGDRTEGIPKGGVYYSCVGRGPNLFDQSARELEIIQQQLGDFPLVGFFGNGEISHNRLYGYTGVLTLFL